MNKKIVSSLALILGLLLLSLSQTASVQSVLVVIPNKGTLIMETIDEPESVDPAWAYDTASSELIANVYERLIQFGCYPVYPPDPNSPKGFPEAVDRFEPALAKGWKIEKINMPVTLTDGIDPETGLPDPDHNHGSGLSTTVTYLEKASFTVRLANDTGQPLKFQSGDTLKMEDVEYSFERWMVQDRSGGPTWMMSEPVMGISIYHVDSSDPLQDEIIDSAFRITFASPVEGTFEMLLQVRYSPILKILAQSWASIVNKSFMSAAPVNDWPGTWINWTNWNDPPITPVDAAGHLMDGTGPYKKDYWYPVLGEWSIIKFRDYWGGWPAQHCSRYLDRVTEKVVLEWATRLADFLAGAADIVYVPRCYIAQVQGQPGIRGIKDLPSLNADAMFFNFDINATSPYIGNGQLGNGIPTNFFSDIRIRKAFACLFNYSGFIDGAWHGEAIQPSSPIIEGIPYHIDVTTYNFNLTKATELFINASNDPTSPAYQVWELGFNFTLIYSGGGNRRVAAEMIKANAYSINYLFKITTLGLSWSNYLHQLWDHTIARRFKSILPMFIGGWLADYVDPHAMVWPFMHSKGTFAYPCSYSNPTVDELIETGIGTPDSPYIETLTVTNTTTVNKLNPRCSYWTDVVMNTYHLDAYLDTPNTPLGLTPSDFVRLKNTATQKTKWYHVTNVVGDDITMDLEFSRASVYAQLQWLYYVDVPSVMLAQPLGRHWERDWVQGWYYNPIQGGSHILQFDCTDPQGTLLYFHHLWKGLNGDINGDNIVNILDAALISAHWYTPPAPPGPLGYDVIADLSPYLQYVGPNPPQTSLPQGAPSIGRVDIMDAVVINAHWLETDP